MDFRNLFYHLYKDKHTQFYGFDVNSLVFDYCLLFYLESIRTERKLDRWLDNEYRINIIQQTTNPILIKRSQTIVDPRHRGMFLDSFDKPSIPDHEIKIAYNSDNFELFEMILVKETVLSAELKRIKEKALKTKSIVFFKWVQSSQNLSEIFEDFKLVEARPGKESLYLTSIHKGKVEKMQI